MKVKRLGKFLINIEQICYIDNKFITENTDEIEAIVTMSDGKHINYIFNNREEFLEFFEMGKKAKIWEVVYNYLKKMIKL